MQSHHCLKSATGPRPRLETSAEQSSRGAGRKSLGRRNTTARRLEKELVSEWKLNENLFYLEEARPL